MVYKLTFLFHQRTHVYKKKKKKHGKYGKYGKCKSICEKDDF